ncbi:MAG: glycoside hydrolase family 55 protein [Planctomycetota bacterium]|jgi:hypothetical protein|nr:glycoside hydrolase family 55 protein [Planctomycetota bacterium]
MRFIILSLVLCGLAAVDTDPRFVPPADANIINVRDHGAKGDGVADDSPAIMAAIVAAYERDSRYGSPPFVYFPAGTYLVTRSIEARRGTTGWSSGWLAGCLLVGEQRTTTTIKLADGAEGYGDAAKPKWLLATGSESDGPNKRNGGGNRAFRHAIMNLTVNVGANNPGASAIDFVVSNRGTIENCDIIAPEGSGYCGIRMDREWPGPGLVSRVRIIGFDYGVSMDHHAQYSMTFEDIELSGQRKAGFVGKTNPMFVRRLHSDNAVPAFLIKGDRHLLVLTDSELVGAEADRAIISKATVLMRDTTVRGYTTILDDTSKANRDLQADDPSKTQMVKQYTIGFEQKGAKALRLPVEETPRFISEDSSTWVNGAADLQAAIDGGAEVIYIPNGGIKLTETLIVRGKVRKIIGFQSWIGAPKENPPNPLIRIEDTKHPVIFEHLWFNGRVEHHGNNAVVFSHVDLNKGYRGVGTGKTFLEDVIGKYNIAEGHRLWARQTNAEFGKEALLVNNGGTMWLFGYKTEGEMPVLQNTGGQVEVLGGLFYALRKVPKNNPLFVLEGGQASLTWAYNGSNYNLNVRQRANSDAEWVEDREWYHRGPALWSNGQD